MSQKQSQPLVNGEVPHSQTFNHVKSYPLCSDLITMYEKNSLGAKSINAAQSFYAKFARPVLPYFSTPYSIVSPYLAKADSLGDSTLKSVDDRFPGLKTTNWEKLRSTAFDAAHYPFKLAGDGRSYVYSTYDDEYKKASGEGSGLVTTGKAIYSTQLRMVSEAFHAAGSYLEPKKEQLEADFEKAKKTGHEKLHKTKKAAQEKQTEMVNSH